MSKAKFEAAKELIKEKKYNQARQLLADIDHPTAREWEARLDKLDPPLNVEFPVVETDPRIGKPAKKRASISPLQFLLLLVGCGIIFYVSSQQSSPQVAQSPTNTPNVAQAATNSANATNIALTPSATPTITFTPSATSTIIDTPIPSATPTITLTPTPVPTDVPPIGTRGNPYPIGQAGAIRDGRFQVNALRRNQSAAVNQMNQFNTKAKAGKEWMLASVTFYCDLASDKTCNTTVMQIELVGDLGVVYDHELFAVLDNKFDGEVFGGGSKTGVLGFIVTSSDKNLLVAVNDLGNRVFFRGEG